MDRTIFLLVLSLLCLTFFSALEPAWCNPPASNNNYSPYRLNSVLARNGEHLSYFKTSVFSYTIQWGFVFTINRGLGRDIRRSNFKRWLKNMATLPEIPDGDGWITNYIGHPLLGASVYAFYKNRGFSHKASAAGTLIQSTLFEYTVEGWKQPPSGVDLIVTPLLGTLIGSQVGMNSLLLSSSYAITKYIFGLF
ncbi:MAG: DUF3943 domain-containing protein [bacterium]